MVDSNVRSRTKRETMDEARLNRLHLPSLSISGFRGIKEVSIPRLGRVTLLAGRNASGKTTVLEAVRAFAARGREAVLFSLLHGREEFSTVVDDDADKVLVPNLAALFHGREAFKGSKVAIGPEDGGDGDTLAIELVLPTEEQVAFLDKMFPQEPFLLSQDPLESLMIQTQYGGGKREVPWSPAGHRMGVDHYNLYRRYPRLNGDDDLPKALECRMLGPDVTSNRVLADLWDDVVLTEDEDRATEVLQLVAGAALERVALRSADSRRRSGSPHFVAKLRGHRDPVPLKSLGDGATRLLGVSLSLSNSRNGFLLIDEAENGLHHSVHYDYWRMVLQAAEENDVQVLATTHSFSCVRGFAKAAVESASDGVLVRIERHEDDTRAVSYAEEELRVASEQGIEVR